MKSDLWANYETALKLILTGSMTGRLDNDQQTVFKNMLSQGMTRVKDYSEPFKPGRDLLDVQTQEYYIDEENDEHETYYYIPDVFKLMIQVHGKRSIHTLPVDLNYLNSLSGSTGEIEFISGEASEHQEWLESPEGKEYWNLLCRKIDIQHDIADLETTHHQGIPSEKESKKRQRAELDDELENVIKRLGEIDGMGFIQTKPVPSKPEMAWIEISKNIAIAIREEIEGIERKPLAKKVHSILTEKNITGRGGHVPSEDSVLRRGLPKYL